MAYQIPLATLRPRSRTTRRPGLLDSVRAAIEQFGVVQVINHGVDVGLIE
jgi:hypothetical protein